jgi:hypothetical protein
MFFLNHIYCQSDTVVYNTIVDELSYEINVNFNRIDSLFIFIEIDTISSTLIAKNGKLKTFKNVDEYFIENNRAILKIKRSDNNVSFELGVAGSYYIGSFYIYYCDENWLAKNLFYTVSME